MLDEQAPVAILDGIKLGFPLAKESGSLGLARLAEQYGKLLECSQVDGADLDARLQNLPLVVPISPAGREPGADVKQLGFEQGVGREVR